MYDQAGGDDDETFQICICRGDEGEACPTCGGAVFEAEKVIHDDDGGGEYDDDDGRGGDDDNDGGGDNGHMMMMPTCEGAVFKKVIHLSW